MVIFLNPAQALPLRGVFCPLYWTARAQFEADAEAREDGSPVVRILAGMVEPVPPQHGLPGPTGLGKSRYSRRLIRRLRQQFPGRPVVVFVPTHRLDTCRGADLRQSEGRRHRAQGTLQRCPAGGGGRL